MVSSFGVECFLESWSLASASKYFLATHRQEKNGKYQNQCFMCAFSVVSTSKLTIPLHVLSEYTSASRIFQSFRDEVSKMAMQTNRSYDTFRLAEMEYVQVKLQS
ncbi:hypothetical protein Leryth_015204 [Lithospermum erythrorhizon]|nr:hypothetical protein Leryth_015204 [Lithospermum erythrorhizon]